MKLSKTKEIISSYIPKKGFYDLSDKPDVLSNKEYAQILKQQMWLMKVNENKEHYINMDKNSWFIAKQISVKVQQLIFTYWPKYLSGEE